MEEDSQFKRGTPNFCHQLLGYLLLLFSIFGGSSIGLMSNLMPTDNSFVYNSWRSGNNFCAYLVPALIEY